MAKVAFVLGQQPKNFKKSVEFPMLNAGETGCIEITYKYRTRIEYGEFVDGWQKQREAASNSEMEKVLKEHNAAVQAAKDAGTEPPELKPMGQLKLQSTVVEASAEYLEQIAEGWDLPQEFNLENLRLLCNTMASAAKNISETYRIALTEARLGN
jgi:hypothetical protein